MKEYKCIYKKTLNMSYSRAPNEPSPICMFPTSIGNFERKISQVTFDPRKSHF